MKAASVADILHHNGNVRGMSQEEENE